MLLHQVALVSESKEVPFGALSTVSAALQKQASRDFGPIWEVSATVDAFAKLEDVPLGYWPILIQDDIKTPDASGVHQDRNGQPFALVQASEQWALTASHECLEMLADPFGNRLLAGQSPRKGQSRVEFLVEVCDPCEDQAFAYQVNGVTVSDFLTPHYFDPVSRPGVSYSFRGSIKAPREVPKGGYLSWHDPVSDHWFQLTNFGSSKIGDLGVLGRSEGNLREAIDKRTPTPFERRALKGKLTKPTAQGGYQLGTISESLRYDARSLREEIKRVKRAGK